MKIPKLLLDKRIPEAVTIIQSVYPKDVNNNNKIEISSTERGHANAFGANMVMSNPLMAAILLDKNAKDVAKVFFMLLKEKQNTTISKESLVEYLISLQGNIDKKIRMDLAICAVAIKMALRTFPTKPE